MGNNPPGPKRLAAAVVVAFHGDEQSLSPRDRALFELVHLIMGERLAYATLMYVWDAQLPVGSVVNYSRTSRIRYLVAESGPERAPSPAGERGHTLAYVKWARRLAV